MSLILLLAQETATPATAMGALIAVVMALITLLVWLLRHIFTVTIPGMQDTFRGEMSAERAQCKDQVDAALERIDKTLDLIRSNQDEYRKDQEDWRMRWQKTHGSV